MSFFIDPLKIPQHKHFIKDLVRRRQNSFLCSPGETKHLNYRPPSVVSSSRHRYRLKLIFGPALLMNRPIWNRPWLAQQGAVQTKYKKETFYQSSVSASLDEDFSQNQHSLSANRNLAWRIRNHRVKILGGSTVDFWVCFDTRRAMLSHASRCSTTRRRKRNTGVLWYIPLTPIPVWYQTGSPKNFLKALERRRSFI